MYVYNLESLASQFYACDLYVVQTIYLCAIML